MNVRYAMIKELFNMCGFYLTKNQTATLLCLKTNEIDELRKKGELFVDDIYYHDSKRWHFSITSIVDYILKYYNPVFEKTISIDKTIMQGVNKCANIYN
ncbi:hypothetical protein [Sulfurimonas indica]|uniref:hypothetical protein n=1 Tax=Sulfurimonas TaxID=202746 RepID=UPI0012649198|nr:hypothetical protein [Sulfurimonas indica]